MSSRGYTEDLSTLLYLVPFLASGVYGLVLWVQSGISAILPATVFLTVTRDPIIFIIGSASVLLGIVVEVNGTDPDSRAAKLASLSNTLQSVAIASLVLVFISALYANGFTDLSGTATDMIVGRYGLVFPAIIVLLSYLVTAQFRFASITNRRVLAIVAMLLVPASLYELGRRQTALGLLVALAFLLIGLGLYLLPDRKADTSKQE